MTEDSICKNCEHQGRVEVLRLPKVRPQETVRRWCKERIELDDLDKVISCTEHRRKGGKIPSADKSRWEKDR